MSTIIVPTEARLDEIERLVTTASVDAGLQSRILQFLAGEIGATGSEKPLSEDNRALIEALAYAALRFAEGINERLEAAEIALIDCRSTHTEEVQP